MKKIFYALLVIMLTISFATMSFAETETDDDTDEVSAAAEETEGGLQFTVKKLSGKITITDVSEIETESIVIPAVVDGKKVESIGSGLFKNNGTLESVIIEDGIASISAKCFYKCKNLSFVYIPSSVKNIASDAFDGCSENLVVMCEDGSKAQSFAEREKLYVLNDIHIHGDGSTVLLVGEINEAESCDEEGYIEIICVDCPESYTAECVIPAKKHDFSTKWTVDKEANCEDFGSKSKHCKNCDAKTEVTLIDPEHDFSAWDVIEEATCKKYGKKERECSLCGEIEQEVITPAEGGHRYGSWTVQYEESCLTDGKKYRKCKDCGNTETRVIEARGSHDFGEWVVSVAASVKTSGVEKRTCEVCSSVETRSIPPVGMSDNAIEIEDKGTAYTLFNSGINGGSGNGHHHMYEGTIDNGGTDLYADSMETMIIGTGFKVDNEVTEIAEISITAYDTDEEQGERDAIYLVDDTEYSRVFIGALSGMDERWNTTTLRISPTLFKKGHSYHFELSEEVSGWVVWVRTVTITFSGISKSEKGIREADFSANIDNSGKITMVLKASSFEENDEYILEFKAVESSTSYQRAGKEEKITLGTESVTKEFSMNLDSGSPQGIYQIFVSFRKSDSLSTKFTANATAGYSLLAVSYSSNGGTNNIPVDTKSYKKGDEVQVLFDYIPSRQDHEFCGWAHKIDAKVPDYTQDGNKKFEIRENTVLYAVWKSEEKSGFDYAENADGTVFLEKYTGNETHVVIPETIDGKKVTGISDFAFKGCSFIIDITIHADIKFIGKGVFAGCSSLENIFVDDMNRYFCDVDGVLYSKDMTVLICYPAAKGGNSYSVPVSVVTITEYAFYGNVHINVIIVGDVKRIGDYAFSGCIHFENIERHDGKVFVITDVEIGIGIFTQTNILTVYNGYHGGYYGDILYYFDTVFTDIAYIRPETIKIAHSVFKGAELSAVILHEGLLEIADYAFYDCDKLTSITVPSTVKKIGSYAFAECDNLKMVVIPSSVEYIGEKAFENSPDAVIYGEKGSYAEQYAKENSIPFVELKSEFTKYVYVINVDLTITVICYIGGGTEIIIPDRIGDFVITSIADGVFEGCENMTVIRIPSTVTYISKFAFVGCRSLLNIIVEETNTSYYTINGVLYCYDGNQLICFPQGMQMKGYVFAGWFTEDGKLIDFNTEEELDFDRAIYAKWLPAEKSIILNIDSTEATVFGKDSKTDVPPVIMDGSTMLPVRFISENFGADVEWDGATRTVIITYGEKQIKLTIDQKEAYINGEKYELDVPATITDGFTVVPVRFIAEALGSKVEWVPETRQVIIIKGKTTEIKADNQLSN